MRNLFLIIIFIYSNSILATDGELFFDISDISGSWTFKFETIPGEVYYDEFFLPGCQEPFLNNKIASCKLLTHL
jgi:hypothetical protein